MKVFFINMYMTNMSGLVFTQEKNVNKWNTVKMECKLEFTLIKKSLNGFYVYTFFGMMACYVSNFSQNFTYFEWI